VLAHVGTPPTLVAQSMMGGGRDLRGGREAMTERLAGLAPELRAYLDALLRERHPERDRRHALDARVGTTHYESAGADIAEFVGTLAYRFVAPRFSVSLGSGPLRFESEDTLSVTGFAPLRLSVDFGLGSQDSLRLAARGPSWPASLTRAEVMALTSVGTAAADLSSVQFGTPGSASARFVHVMQFHRSVSIAAMLGGDFEPRPGGQEAVYWRGTTALAGLVVNDSGGRTRLGGSVTITRSFTDSLDGRNLFSGGGTVLTRVHGATLLARPEDVFVGASATYFRPYAAGAASAGASFPLRDFAGASALLGWPIGSLLLSPAAVLSVESSETSTGTGSVEGSGWSLRTSLGVDVPMGRSAALTPEVGYTTGSVRLDVVTIVGTTPAGDPITRTSRSMDPLSGWWFAASWAVAF